MADLKRRIEADPGVVAKEKALAEAVERWWSRNRSAIAELPETGELMELRARLLESFEAALRPVNLLDRFQVAGVVATWWGEVQNDLKTLAARGFLGLVEAWETGILTAMEDRDSKENPLEHRLVKRLLPEYLEEIGELEGRKAELAVPVKGAAVACEEEDGEEAEGRISEEELRALKKELGRSPASATSPASTPPSPSRPNAGPPDGVGSIAAATVASFPSAKRARQDEQDRARPHRGTARDRAVLPRGGPWGRTSRTPRPESLQLCDCVCAIITLMVVVVDTSVFVSALLGPGGASRAVLRAALEGHLEPVMGASLFAEYEALMSRHQLFEGSVLSSDERDEVLDAFLSVCRWTRIYFLWRPNLRDEADNHVLELAVAGGAEAIITKNTRDFVRGDLAFPGIRILTPVEILKEIRS